MPTTRRTVNRLIAAAAIAPRAVGAASGRGHRSGHDVAVIGAGVFGAWTAHYLRKAGFRVLLLDAYGPANSRASSGGESRIIRTAYGEESFYSAWAWKSLPQWRSLERRSGTTLFERTGVLAFGEPASGFLSASAHALASLGIPFERLSSAELARRFPQVHFRSAEEGLLEPAAGVLFARRAVQALVAELVRAGVAYRRVAVGAPTGEGRRAAVETRDGEPLAADGFVYACGPWLPRLFPRFLAERVRADRAEVFFLGSRAGDTRYAPPTMPTWMDVNDGAEAWGMPELEQRGFKIAIDRRTVPADPDAMDRRTSPEWLADVREYVAVRFPGLAGAPVVETRVCQYEMSPGEQYLVDRHPDYDNVWWVGGGSGHGFKNGPAMGECAAAVVQGDRPIEARFRRAP